MKREVRLRIGLRGGAEVSLELLNGRAEGQLGRSRGHQGEGHNLLLGNGSSQVCWEGWLQQKHQTWGLALF